MSAARDRNAISAIDRNRRSGRDVIADIRRGEVDRDEGDLRIGRNGLGVVAWSRTWLTVSV
jgi:hypothetical protein